MMIIIVLKINIRLFEMFYFFSSGLVNSLPAVVSNEYHIFGDPGATSRVEGIFMGESLLQERALLFL